MGEMDRSHIDEGVYGLDWWTGLGDWNGLELVDWNGLDWTLQYTTHSLVDCHKVPVLD